MALSADSCVSNAIALWRSGRRQEAEAICAQIAGRQHATATREQLQEQAQALDMLAEIQRGSNRRHDELATLRRLSVLRTDDAALWRRMGNAELATGDAAGAVASLRRSLELDPDNTRALNNLGLALTRCGQRAEAMCCYSQVIRLDPRHAGAHNNLGDALREEGRLEEAVESYRRALTLDAQLLVALCSCAGALSELRRFEEAVVCCDAALVLRPDCTDALVKRAHALRQLYRLEEAVRDCERALELRPDLAFALQTLAEARATTGQMQLARESLQKLLQLQPARDDVRMLWVMSHVPRVPRSEQEAEAAMTGFAESHAQLLQSLESNAQVDSPAVIDVAVPFFIAYQTEGSNRALLTRHGGLCQTMMGRWHARNTLPSLAASAPGPDRRRVAIVSAHLRDHSVYHSLVKGWIGQLDRRGIELGVVHLSANEDQETEWVKARADFFISGVRSLRDWVLTIENLSPQILIFPEIGMNPLTLQLASLRLAHHQVAAWGHPETTGLATIDYYLSAQRFEPPEGQDYYSERLVRLPNLGCYYEPYQLTPVMVDLKPYGIDDDSAVLLCPGMPYKYAPRYDHIYPEIAQRAPNCRLVFFTSPVPRLSENFRQRLIDAFRLRGLVPAEHIAFIPWQTPAEFFGLLQRADVLLDSVGFSGFNTTMQAVECGLPVVAFEGQFMRGRFASGILQQAGLPDLIARTPDEFVGLSARLAQEPDLRAEVRRRMHAGVHDLFRDASAIGGLRAFLEQLG